MPRKKLSNAAWWSLQSAIPFSSIGFRVVAHVSLVAELLLRQATDSALHVQPPPQLL